MVSTRPVRPPGETALLVIGMRRANPCATGVAIANAVGVSRQRVNTILREANEPTKAYHERRLWVCPVCGTISKYKFCSRTCLSTWKHVPLVCARCGKLYYVPCHRVMKAGRERQEHDFCSKRCSGIWWGKHFGTARRGVRYAGSINRGWVRQVYLLSGWPPKRVAEHLGLNRATVMSILYRRPSARGG